MKEITMTEDQFYAKYKLIKNHLDKNAAFDGCMFETYGKEVMYVHSLSTSKKDSDRRRVWTILDGEGELFYSSGYHIVNRLGYLITEKPFPKNQDILVECEKFEPEEYEPEIDITKIGEYLKKDNTDEQLLK